MHVSDHPAAIVRCSNNGRGVYASFGRPKYFELDTLLYNSMPVQAIGSVLLNETHAHDDRSKKPATAHMFIAVKIDTLPVTDW